MVPNRASSRELTCIYSLPLGELCTPSSTREIKQKLLALQQSNYIDQSTRAIIITFTTFIPNTGALVNTRLAIELSYSGTIETSYENDGVIFFFKSSDLLKRQVVTVLLLLCQVLFISSTIWPVFFNKEVDSLTWLVLDGASCGLMIYQQYLLVGFLFVQESYYGDLNEQLTLSNVEFPGSKFYNGNNLASLRSLVVVNCCLFMLSGLRLFRSSQYLDWMRVLHTTLDQVYLDAILYFSLNFLLSLGFMLFGVIVLGGDLQEYSNYPTAVFYVLQYFILSIDYYSVYNVQPLGVYIAPIYFVPFILMFTWYLASVFTAVLYLAYRSAKTIREREMRNEKRWQSKASENGAYFGGSARGRSNHVKYLYTSKNRRRLESFRTFLGLPEIEGFTSEEDALVLVKQFESANPQKRFLSFAEVLGLFSNRNKSGFAYANLEDEQGLLKDDQYLDSLDPLLLQVCRLFRQVWMIPEDRLPFFERMDSEETLMVKRPVLMKIQEAMRRLEAEQARFAGMVVEQQKSLKVLNEAMERDIRSIREIHG